MRISSNFIFAFCQVTCSDTFHFVKQLFVMLFCDSIQKVNAEHNAKAEDTDKESDQERVAELLAWF